MSEWMSFTHQAPRPSFPRTASFIYAIQVGADGPIKIGRSASSGVRLQELQIGNPIPLHLLGAAPETNDLNEQSEHVRLKDRRIRGEWFDITPADLPWLNMPERADLTPLNRECPHCDGSGVVSEAITLREAARRLGTTVRHVRKMIDENIITAGFVGQALMIDPSEISSILDTVPAEHVP